MAPGEAIAEVRAFAVARAGERALVAYVQSGDPYARGALRLAMLRANGGADGQPVLDRVGSDRTLAPAAVALALEWDPARGGGAIAYVMPRPHRGETPAARAGQRRPAEAVARALESPVGPAAISAGDVMLQALDAEGAPVGRPVLVFEENARAYRVALARAEGGAWLLAWTGAITSDDELVGTVRWSQVTAQGVARPFASETGFAGQTGDALFVLAGRGGGATIVFDGERCGARAGAPAFSTRVVPTGSLSAQRPAGAPPPPMPHERRGAPIACGPLRVWSALGRADGTTSAPIEGPVVGRDALGLVAAQPGAAGGRAGTPLLVAPREGALVALAVDAAGARVGERASRVLVSAEAAGEADAIARAPGSIAVAGDGAGGLAFAAMAPGRTRVAFGVQRAGASAATGVTAIAPPGGSDARVQAIALAGGSAAGAPWVFAQLGDPMMGPLVLLDTSRPSESGATSMEASDERLRALLVRVRQARAEYTRAESGVMYAVARPDAATNPNLPGMQAGLRRLRDVWEVACEPLLERARYLARHGTDAGVNDVARQACELPPEPGAAPPEAGAAGGAAPPPPGP